VVPPVVAQRALAYSLPGLCRCCLGKRRRHTPPRWRRPCGAARRGGEARQSAAAPGCRWWLFATALLAWLRVASVSTTSPGRGRFSGAGCGSRQPGAGRGDDGAVVATLWWPYASLLAAPAWWLSPSASAAGAHRLTRLTRGARLADFHGADRRRRGSDSPGLLHRGGGRGSGGAAGGRPGWWRPLPRAATQPRFVERAAWRRGRPYGGGHHRVFGRRHQVRRHPVAGHAACGRLPASFNNRWGWPGDQRGPRPGVEVIAEMAPSAAARSPTCAAGSPASA
jgi:hypothetical protein